MDRREARAAKTIPRSPAFTLIYAKIIQMDEVKTSRKLEIKRDRREKKLYRIKERMREDNQELNKTSREISAWFLENPWKIFLDKYLYRKLGIKRFGITIDEIKKDLV